VNRLPRSDADGFTLIELLIAMVIMGTAVVVLVGAMASVVTASENHRGYATTETAVRAYAEAVQAKATFGTTLTTAGGINASVGSFTVGDVTGFMLQTFHQFDIVVDEETMTVSAVSASTKTLTVNRGVGGASGAVSHAQGATVSQLFMCPTAAFSSAANGWVNADVASAALTAQGLTPSISVEYWDPAAQSFTSSQATCQAHDDAVCVFGGLRPECDTGIIRVTLGVTSSTAQLGSVSTKTQVILRRGVA
jgi:prepilin-type N-terminal cleavage/methylation domain-containing protein